MSELCVLIMSFTYDVSVMIYLEYVDRVWCQVKS